MKRIDPLIQVGREQVRLSVIVATTESRHLYLSRYRGVYGAVQCLCRDPGIRMSVRFRDPTYYLQAQHIGDGIKHRYSCPFHHDEQGSGSGTVSLPVIEQDGESINLNLELPRYRRPAAEPSSSRNRGPQGEAREQRRGRMLTLAELLWSEAGLNSWHKGFEGKRSYAIVRHRLLEAKAHIKINGVEAGGGIFMPPAFRPNNPDTLDQARFEDFLQEDDKKRRPIGLVIGVLRQLEATPGRGIALTLAQSNMRFWFSREQWEKYARKWFNNRTPEQIKAAADETHVVVIGVTRVPNRKDPARFWFKVEDLGVMPVSDQRTWIPVDSNHERRMVHHLIEQHRTFTKPLAIDRADGELLPDFILEDLPGDLIIEVTGRMSDHEYREKIEHKRERYVREGRAVLWWDPERQPDLPELPPSERRKRSD